MQNDEGENITPHMPVELEQRQRTGSLAGIGIRQIEIGTCQGQILAVWRLFESPCGVNFLLAFVGSATSEAKLVGAQNFALCKVLGSKCEENSCTTHS